MKKPCCRIIAGLIALVLLLGTLPTQGLAASSYPNTHANTGNQAADIVAVAVTQAGYCEGSLSGNPSYASSSNYQKYGQWYDANVDNIGVTRAAWCAAFVSWCANQAGVSSSTVYYHAYCPYGVNWFKNQGRFQYAASRGGTYVPKAGDIVYFAPSGSSTSSHVGIVRYAKNGYVYTVEGNTSGQNGEVNEGGGVFLKSYSLSYSRLYGYGTPNYSDNSGHTITFDSNGGSTVASATVVDGGTLTAPANPTRYGFNFVGWYCNPELTDPYNFSTRVQYSFTLYAKWEEAYWGANTDLMPVDGLLTCNNYDNSGQYIWPYYNDDGSVTMYNGVANDVNYSWPSAYMCYENSVDSGNDAYIYVKYNATARFNATIDYLDADGNPQSVKLSQLAGRGDTDFPAGYNEFFVNFGQYVYDQGHLTTSDGSAHSVNIKYTKVTYYVVGGLDEYVRLYDMKFTPAFAIEQSYSSLMSADITQHDGSGSYVYNDGTLTVTSNTDLGYSLSMNTSQMVDPTDFSYLLASIESDVPFNITMDVVQADGTVATMDLSKEYYPVFGGLAEAPQALPAGTWRPVMDLLGYFKWNGGETDSTTISNITITLAGQGTLVLADLQAARGMEPKDVSDGQSSSGSYDNTFLITFVSNGGSEVSSVSVRAGETLTKPTDPTRYGYSFAGWYCNPELTDPYDFSTPVPYSFKLYAKWDYWPVNNDLMPVENQLQLDNYQGTGQYLWPYYNDDGSVTMYNGVTNDENHAWPSAYMNYENSVDLAVNPYIHVKYTADAQFNAEIEYMAADGTLHTVMLSEIAGLSTADFPSGDQEFYVDFGSWLLDQGHIPDSLRQNYTKVTYFVVGGLDEYVRLYDISFTDAYTVTFEPNGGSEVHRMAVGKGETISTPAAPTRYGYDFAGWYCDPELKDLYDFSSAVNYSFTLYAKWTPSGDTVYDGGMAGDGVIHAEGIDISYWNGASFDLQAIKDAGYDYVIIRAGSTNLGKDSCFETFYAAARAAGLDVGAYFYSYALNAEDAVSDANKCLSYIQGKTFEYPIYFDYEDPSQNELSQAASTEICLAFMNTVANAGYLTGIYSGAYRLSTMDMATLGADHEVWVAHYKDNTHTTMDPEYSIKYGMYQYTDSMTAGSVGPFDANVCYKDYPSIVKTYGLNGYSRPSHQHSYTTVVTPPTCTAGGYTTYSCSCGHSYIGDETPAADHNYVDGTCTACGGADPNYVKPVEKFDIAMTSMTMGNSLAMNIAFEQAEVSDWTGHYAVITKTYADGRENVVETVAFADWKSANIGGVAHYYVTFNGIAAKEMTDDINVVIYNANDEAVSNVYTDSVAAQSARILAKDTTSDEEKTMIVDMLNYGAAAQEYFGYGTDKLANADLTEEQKAYASEAKACTDIRVKGDNYVATNVVLKSNIQMMFAFQNIDTTMTAKVTFTNHRGVDKEVTVNGADFTKNGSFYVVTVDALVVADGRQAVTCVIYDADGNQVANATDSLESYTARKNGAEDIFVKMMQYSDSAYAYFH